MKGREEKKHPVTAEKRSIMGGGEKPLSGSSGKGGMRSSSSKKEFRGKDHHSQKGRDYQKKERTSKSERGKKRNTNLLERKKFVRWATYGRKKLPS